MGGGSVDAINGALSGRIGAGTSSYNVYVAMDIDLGWEPRDPADPAGGTGFAVQSPGSANAPGYRGRGDKGPLAGDELNGLDAIAETSHYYGHTVTALDPVPEGYWGGLDNSGPSTDPSRPGPIDRTHVPGAEPVFDPKADVYYEPDYPSIPGTPTPYQDAILRQAEVARRAAEQARKEAVKKNGGDGPPGMRTPHDDGGHNPTDDGKRGGSGKRGAPKTDFSSDRGNRKDGSDLPQDASDKREGPRPVLLDLDGDGIQIPELSQSLAFMHVSTDGLQNPTFRAF